MDLRIAEKASLKAPHIGVIEIMQGNSLEVQYTVTNQPGHDDLYATTPLDGLFDFQVENHKAVPRNDEHAWEFYLDCGFATDPISLVPINEMKPAGWINFKRTKQGRPKLSIHML